MKDEDEKKVVLLTGCSSGIGFETSLLLAKRGYKVYSTVRNIEKSVNLTKAINEDNLDITILLMDVTKEKSIKNAIDNVISDTGRLDAVINNAGFGLYGPIEYLSKEEIRAQFETNFFGIIEIIQQVLPIMRKQNNGRIINVSSISGRIGFPLSSLYVSSKFALEGLSESLRFELSKFGINIILIEPGIVKTEFGKNLIMNKEAIDVLSPYSDIFTQRMDKLITRFKNGILPVKVAEVIYTAISDKNPKLRYPIGDDSFDLLAIQKSMSDKDFFEYLKKIL